MNSRQLGILAVATAIAILAAIWIATSRNPSAPTSQTFLPSLSGQLGNVKQIKIFGPGDKPAVDLAAADTGWTVQQRNYPADANKVKGLLIALESAKVLEEKTSNSNNYATLGVEDLNSAGAKNVRVALSNKDVLADVIVGKSDGHGNYVRRAGEKQSWLIDQQLDVPADPAKWLRREIVDIGADRIQSEEVHIGKERPYTSAKTNRADANFTVTPLPKGRELNSVSTANAVAQTLVHLQLDDVQPASTLAKDTPAATATYRTFDGLVIAIDGYVQDGKHYVTLQPSFDEDLAKRFHLATTAAKSDVTNTKTDAGKQTSPSADSLANALKHGHAEAETLQKKLQGWAYIIPEYKYNAIFRPLDELLKKPEKLGKSKAK